MNQKCRISCSQSCKFIGANADETVGPDAGLQSNSHAKSAPEVFTKSGLVSSVFTLLHFILDSPFWRARYDLTRHHVEKRRQEASRLCDTYHRRRDSWGNGGCRSIVQPLSMILMIIPYSYVASRSIQSKSGCSSPGLDGPQGYVFTTTL